MSPENASGTPARCGSVAKSSGDGGSDAMFVVLSLSRSISGMRLIKEISVACLNRRGQFLRAPLAHARPPLPSPPIAHNGL